MHEAARLLCEWIARQAPAETMEWLERQRSLVAQPNAPTYALATAISAAPRRLGRNELMLSDDDLACAHAARTGWKPRGASIDQAARIVLLLDAAPHAQNFAATLQRLVAVADLGERVALYRGLPLYPAPDTLVAFAVDGLRTAMQSVFEAVAHASPFPAETFGEAAWNQMVLKALFIDARLDAIDGLDARCNPDLAATLCDYAHERWAAGRAVSPELWRCVGRFADAQALGDLERVLRTGTPVEQRAAALALADCGGPQARRLLASMPHLQAAIDAGTISWSTFER